MSYRITKGEALAGTFKSDKGMTCSSGLDTATLTSHTVTSSSGGFVFTSSTATITRKVKAIAFASTKTSEVDSAWDVPNSALITDCYIKITTASTAAGTVSVGLITTSSGDADGFIASLGTSSSGIKYPTATITAVTSGDPVSGCTRGKLLCFYSTASTQDEFGNYAPTAFPTDSMLEKSVSYTFNSTSGTAGYIFFEYTEI